VTVAGVLLGAAIALAVPPLRDAVLDAVQGDTGDVRHDLGGDVGGVLLVLWLALVHVIVWYPAEILDAAVGYVFGFGLGFPLVHASWVISGMVAYWVGHHAARPVLYRVVGEERFKRVEGLIHRGGVTFLLTARLVPIVPFSLMGYVCGAARVPFGRYVWTTLVGYAPITAYFTYLGSRLESFSVEDPIVWIGAAGFLIAIFGVRYLRPGRREEAPQPD
jgi:uncharacterized membrane protein YdjX (TVP38/TMEM64 family)